nr:MAG TPA: hypothetical protein [Caudoviricetes sp.]DAS76328.1 MAG TPA: hypothetical protein [Caudoviricetes sp.]
MEMLGVVLTKVLLNSISTSYLFKEYYLTFFSN